MAHSDLVGGSSAARVIKCPASLGRSRELVKIEEVVSPYAAEGTALHTCMELLLDDEKGTTPEHFIDAEIGGVHITKELVEEKLRPAYDAVKKFFKDRGITSYYLEAEVGFDSHDILHGCFGTCDVIGVPEDPAAPMCIIDYKFGSGVEVYAENNYQLLFYAAACLDPESGIRIFDDCTDVELVIIQPTFPEPIKTHRVPIGRLELFTLELSAAVTSAAHPHAPANPGDHCRWCPAAPYCPEKLAQAGYALEIDPTASESMANALALAEQLEPWIKQVKKHAHELLEHGAAVPGWKLVKKRAARQWIDPAEVENVFKRIRRLNSADYYDQKLRSPAQMEKVCKEKGIDYSEISDYVNSVSSGSTLAHEDDPRPGVVTAGPREVPQNLQKLIDKG